MYIDAPNKGYWDIIAAVGVTFLLASVYLLILSLSQIAGKPTPKPTKPKQKEHVCNGDCLNNPDE